ncbi:hypothetical protein JCM10914A_38780 [Paenibacillus sp. JCM 10914]|uniref:hypothetical protein n=1 Tax=Paenibacillus sp. JCM 10914 TaxID=1236974 RepID=UPI0003CC5CD3|nr:hypothetical protein [Paenibacillus sp. JCM 10914]GAE04592.1 hypothetical protein JCM10914_644 [Paenibacillus sp. JCM 10914]
MRHIPITESEPFQHPPSSKYELAKWYERRGYLTEALESYKDAALSVSCNADAGTPWEEAELSWLEYGAVSIRMRSYDAAEEAYRTVLQHAGSYAQEALQRWAELLYMLGNKDHVIYSRLLLEIKQYSSRSLSVGLALYHIGSYTLAAHCFAREDRLGQTAHIQHVSCLIINKRLQPALELIDQYTADAYATDSDWSQELLLPLHRMRQLCKWRLYGTAPDAATSHDEAIALAEAAVSLGMLQEAEELLADRGEEAAYALICILYLEGYRSLAVSKMDMLEEIPLQGSGPHGIKLCLLISEHLYDQQKYTEAAQVLDQIRQIHPELTAARFGEAACHLQSAMLSLSNRLSSHYRIAPTREVLEQYMAKISTALHIVESTNWHTTWSPAQKRNEIVSSHSSYLN